MKLLPRHFALLAASLLLVACASAPETKTTPRKKKHKKHSDDDVAEKHSKKKKSSDDDSEKPDKPKKKTADASEDEENVTVSDDDEESGAKAKKSKKKKEAEEKAAEEKERKREKEEKAEREKEKAEEKATEEKERKQREKEEKAEREKEKAAEEKEAKAKKKKKASEDVAEDNADEKMAKKKKKNAEEAEEEPAEVDMTGESDGDGDETKAAAKGKKGKAATKAAAKTKPAKGKKDKRKAEEEEPAEASEEVAAEEPESETPVADEKPAKASKGSKAKLAKAEKPAKTKGDKKTEPADADVIEMSGEEDPEADKRVAAMPVPGVDSEHEEPELGTAKANTDEPAAAAVSMTAINDRPLTLAASKLEVHGGLRVNSVTIPASMGTMARTQRSEGLALGVGYGVTDTLEVGADYTVLVNPGTVKGPITFHGAYRAYVTPKLEIAAAVGFALDFDPRVDPVTMKESTQTYAALELGAWARYRLGRKASLFSGIPATPSSSAPITNLAFPLPPEQYQLAVGLNGGPSALDLPIGIGYQVSGSFYTLFMTDLAHIGIKNSPNAFLFKDIIPFALGGFYVFEKVDFGLVLSDDLKKDTLRFDAVVRYPIK